MTNFHRATLILLAAVSVSARILTGAEPAAASAKQATAKQTTPVLAELFTSEGCSSCPPADRLLAELDRTQPVSGAHIIILSEHVDYWNDLGWADPYSSPLFTERQREYASRLDSQGVYTPQLVVDGRASLVGSDRTGAARAIAAAAHGKKIQVRLIGVVRDRGNVTITVELPNGAPSNAAVYLALAGENDESNVARGENAGHRLTHVAVVRQLTKVGTAKPTMPFSASHTFALKTTGERVRLIAIVQDSRSLSVLGAAEEQL
jgi:hypothetical protein